VFGKILLRSVLLMRRATWLAAGAAAVVFSTLYVLFKATRAASARLVADATTVLEFLAWRSECLCHYNPPEEQPPPRAGNDDDALPIQVDAMVVHGNSMAAVPLGAADLYCDLLVRAGCKTVLLTGGVGRETPPLWTELADRGLTAPFADAPWPRDTPPSHVRLPCQNVTKPVLQGVDLTIAPDDLRQYASEADVFLELFVARCRERGVHVAFGGNPMADQPASAAPPPSTQPGPATPRVFLETASTHTGTNVEFSRASLAMLGVEASSSNIVVVQQPALHLRTCLTWEKQTGRRPLGWTVRPTEGAVGRSVAELLQYALGELKRIPSYAAEDKGFCVMPNDFPHELAATVALLENSIDAAVALEKESKQRRAAAAGKSR
jgi:hypothetical protein